MKSIRTIIKESVVDRYHPIVSFDWPFDGLNIEEIEREVIEALTSIWRYIKLDTLDRYKPTITGDMIYRLFYSVAVSKVEKTDDPLQRKAINYSTLWSTADLIIQTRAESPFDKAGFDRFFDDYGFANKLWFGYDHGAVVLFHHDKEPVQIDTSRHVHRIKILPFNWHYIGIFEKYPSFDGTRLIYPDGLRREDMLNMTIHSHPGWYKPCKLDVSALSDFARIYYHNGGKTIKKKFIDLLSTCFSIGYDIVFESRGSLDAFWKRYYGGNNDAAPIVHDLIQEGTDLSLFVACLDKTKSPLPISLDCVLRYDFEIYERSLRFGGFCDREDHGYTMALAHLVGYGVDSIGAFYLPRSLYTANHIKKFLAEKIRGAAETLNEYTSKYEEKVLSHLSCLDATIMEGRDPRTCFGDIDALIDKLLTVYSLKEKIGTYETFIDWFNDESSSHKFVAVHNRQFVILRSRFLDRIKNEWKPKIDAMMTNEYRARFTTRIDFLERLNDLEFVPMTTMPEIVRFVERSGKVDTFVNYLKAVASHAPTSSHFARYSAIIPSNILPNGFYPIIQAFRSLNGLPIFEDEEIHFDAFFKGEHHPKMIQYFVEKFILTRYMRADFLDDYELVLKKATEIYAELRSKFTAC